MVSFLVRHKAAVFPGQLDLLSLVENGSSGIHNARDVTAS